MITVKLALGEVPLVPPQQRRVDLAKSITLNPAVRLLGDTATTDTATTETAMTESAMTETGERRDR